MAPDIAIVGGGPSGLALAAILERKGLDYIVYERSQRDVPPRGGSLDLHPGSGQRAMREAGVFEEFQKHSRTGDATIHLLYNHHGEKVFEFGQGRDAPEIDRWAIREVFLAGIPEHKIVWSKGVEKAERDEDDGRVVLTFTDGTTATGFKLVVGADGTNSQIRHLVSCIPARTVIPSLNQSSRLPLLSQRTLTNSTSPPRSSPETPSTRRWRPSPERAR